jgi:hypothetical protein
LQSGLTAPQGSRTGFIASFDGKSNGHLVHDAVGGPLKPLAAAATIAVGVNSLLVLGVVPVLLGDLVDHGRLSEAGSGQTATLELLAMGVSTAAAGLVKRPRRLRLIAFAASAALAILDLLSAGASHGGLMVLRALAGGVEGVLLWITVAMIARTVTPERWAGIFFTAQVTAQLALAIAFAVWIMPRFGSFGGFVALALVGVAGTAPSLALPSAFAPLPRAEGEGGAPPLRGWIALAATFVFVSGGSAVAVYLQPLAHQAGLGAGVARTALWVSLAAQVAGGAAAVTLAGRIRYFAVFIITSITDLAVWWVFGQQIPAWLFVTANAAGGFVGLFLGPFLVPMTIDSDPSRRAAMQSGAAQLLGAAGGPLLASLVVGDRDVHGVLWMAVFLLLAGLSVVAWLRFNKPPLVGAAERA